jgi:hypothetical protein
LVCASRSCSTGVLAIEGIRTIASDDFKHELLSVGVVAGLHQLLGMLGCAQAEFATCGCQGT